MPLLFVVSSLRNNVEVKIADSQNVEKIFLLSNSSNPTW
jgi:hypothetical protein